VSVAATPLPIVFEFRPEARQIAEPLALPQVSVFPAAVKAAPAAKLSPLTFAVG
jgi:hypothetical protein